MSSPNRDAVTPTAVTSVCVGLSERKRSFLQLKPRFCGFFRQDMLPDPHCVCSSSDLCLLFKFVEPTVAWKWSWVIETPYSSNKWLLNWRKTYKCKWDFASLCSMFCSAVEQLPRMSNYLIPTDVPLWISYPARFCHTQKGCSVQHKGEWIWMEWLKGEEPLLDVFCSARPNTFHVKMILMNCQKQPASSQ